MNNGLLAAQEVDETEDVTEPCLRVIGAQDCGLLMERCKKLGIHCSSAEGIIKFCSGNYLNGAGEIKEANNGHSFFLKFRKKIDFTASEILQLISEDRNFRRNGCQLRILDPFQAIAFYAKRPESLKFLHWYVPGKKHFKNGDRVPALTWVQGKLNLLMTEVEMNPKWAAHWTFPFGIFSLS